MDKNILVKRIEDQFGIDYKGYLMAIDDPTSYIGNRFLPVQNTFDYDWVYNIFDNTVAVARMKAAGDAEAPIVGGPAVKAISGSIAPFGQKFQVNKSILNKIFNPRNDSELKANLRTILNESARNVRAAQARREWLRWEFLAKGVIAINEDKISLEVDMGVPTGNKLTSTDPEIAGGWATAATATPLVDIIRASEKYYTVNGFMPDLVTMRRANLLQVLNADDTKAKIEVPSLETVNQYLASYGMDYPRIETYDEFVRFDNAAGRPVTKYHLIPANRIVFLKEAIGGDNLDQDIGRMLMGPVAENGFQPGIYADIFEETDPKKYWHYMAAEMWPAGYNPEFIMFATIN